MLGLSNINPDQLNTGGYEPSSVSPNGFSFDGLNQGLNTFGSLASLAMMMKNMGEQRKNYRLNRSNIRQQMDQSKTAFDRSIARQNSSLAEVAERDARLAQQRNL